MKPISKHQHAIIAALAGARSDREVADAAGCSHVAVGRYRREHGIKAHGNRVSKTERRHLITVRETTYRRMCEAKKRIELAAGKRLYWEEVILELCK